jgi:hypothetical protein
MANRSKPTPPTPSSTPAYKWLYIGTGLFGAKAHAVPASNLDVRGVYHVGLCRTGGLVQSRRVAPVEDHCKRCMLAISRGVKR